MPFGICAKKKRFQVGKWVVGAVVVLGGGMSRAWVGGG